MVFKFNELKEIKESYVFYTTAGNMQCLQYSSLMLYMWKDRDAEQLLTWVATFIVYEHIFVSLGII